MLNNLALSLLEITWVSVLVHSHLGLKWCKSKGDLQNTLMSWHDSRRIGAQKDQSYLFSPAATWPVSSLILKDIKRNTVKWGLWYFGATCCSSWKRGDVPCCARNLLFAFVCLDTKNRPVPSPFIPVQCLLQGPAQWELAGTSWTYLGEHGQREKTPFGALETIIES